MRPRLALNGSSLSPLGLGTASFAGVNMVGAVDYRPPTQREAIQLLEAAVDALPGAGGLLMVDTSAQYGQSESLLGKCLGAAPAVRERICLASKWGLNFDPVDFCVCDYSIHNLRESVRRSVSHLGRLDLLYLHSNPGVPISVIERFFDDCDGAFSLMCDWRRAGRYGIQGIGISMSSIEHLSLLFRRQDVLDKLDVVQANASLAVDNSYLAARLNQAGVLTVLNSPYRKGDRTLRATFHGRRRLYHRILSRCPDALLLTGTKDGSHLRENIAHMRSWCEPPALEMRYVGGDRGQGDYCGTVEADVLRYFGGFLSCRHARSPTASFDGEVGSLARDLASLLIGTRNTRQGPEPVAARRREIEKRIEAMVADGRPVDVILTWAPRKFYVRGEGNRVDVSELAALARLLDVHVAARELHPQGVRYTIFYEDFEGAYIEQEPDSLFRAYRDSLESLVYVLHLNNVFSIIRTRDWVAARGDSGRLQAQLEENYRAIREYWLESERTGIDRSASLASCQRMNALGFKGVVERATRDHYLRRLDRLLGDSLSPGEKTEMVIRLFACVLLHRQFDAFIVNPKYRPVKLSFLQAAGGPSIVRDGRVDIRSIPASVTKRSLAPWSARGYLRERNGQVTPAMGTWRDVMSFEASLVSGTMSLRRGDRAISVGADLLPGLPARDPHHTGEGAGRRDKS